MLFKNYCSVNVDVIANIWRQICWLKWNGVWGTRTDLCDGEGILEAIHLSERLYNV